MYIQQITDPEKRRYRGPTAILKIVCPDHPGIVASITAEIARYGGNIISCLQKTDLDHNIFLARFEWELEGFELSRDEIPKRLSKNLDPLGGDWKIEFSDHRWRIAVLVSKESHCLSTLIDHTTNGNRKLPGEIVCVISNHRKLETMSRNANLPFSHCPVAPENREEQETVVLKILRESQAGIVVLAKYMQVLSRQFLDEAPFTLNIHHGLLPDVPGARPYARAREHGMKIVGATAHVVTPELDKGPIITQDAVFIGNETSLEGVIRKGHALESQVLVEAAHAWMTHRVIVYNGRTYVFE